jgi:3-oxoadipate enol-lactonase
MFDKGSGPPIVVIPGVQGRWEWMKPALGALSRRCRTISYSLPGDLGSGAKMDWTLGFESLMRQLDGVLDRAGLERAAICGVSFGGLIALRYAATRPARVGAVILVSAPDPTWEPTPQQASYVARPWRSIGSFCFTAFERLGPEIRSSLPTLGRRLRFAAGYVGRALTAPVNPHLMSRRVKLKLASDFACDAARVEAPTLVITGDERLDRVVPVASTRRYAESIPGARHEVMTGTGHLGLLTQSDRFADIVSEFVLGHSH